MERRYGGDGYYGEDMYILIHILTPNWKSWRFSIRIPIPSQYRDSPSKRIQVWAIPTRTGLYPISTHKSM